MDWLEYGGSVLMFGAASVLVGLGVSMLGLTILMLGEVLNDARLDRRLMMDKQIEIEKAKAAALPIPGSPPASPEPPKEAANAEPPA